MLSIDSAYNYIARNFKDSLIFCLLAAVASFIPVFGQLLLAGLSIRIISLSINKKNEIPEVFGNIKNDLLNGLKYCAFGAILSLPVFAIMIPAIIDVSVSSAIMNAVESNDYSSYANVGSSLSSFGLSMNLLMIYLLALLLLTPALVANFAEKQEFSAFFDLKKAWSMVFGNFGLFLKMVGINILYGIALSVIAGILSFTVLIPVLLSYITLLISGRIMGFWSIDAKPKK